MEDWRAVLDNDFGCQDGSFYVQMRCDLHWDVEAFERLTEAMEACCRAQRGKEVIDRWQAQNFHYYSWYVKAWTTHPNFRRDRVAEYYETAYKYLDDLAGWFFEDNPHSPDNAERWRPILQRLKVQQLQGD